MENGGILKIVNVQNWTTLNEEMLNVYWYRMTNLVNPVGLNEVAADIALEFESTVLVPIRAIQSNVIVHTALRMSYYGIIDEDQDILLSPPVAGSALGEITAPNFAWTFKLVRTFKTTRNGSKRIGGTPDSLSTDGRGLNQVGSAFVMNIEAALAATLNVSAVLPATFDLEPVIVHQNPGGLGPSDANPIKQALFRGFGTQNSRKRLL